MNRPPNLRQNKWHTPPSFSPSLQEQLPDINPILLQVLYNRGITEPAKIQAFLENHYLESTDPFLLTDMDKAVTRIQQAIENEEMIIVYGDFDADGVTSTVLLTQALRGLGVERRNAQPYIPDRIEEGYGLNEKAMDKLKEKGASLIISVDCGIRSVPEVKHAIEIGLDMIITDHHGLGPELPPATAVINPKRPNSTYPEIMLAGVGIAYKLAQALRQSMPERAQFQDKDLLDLVAIGTVADLAPLLGENRKLVADGLKAMNETKRPGIAALVEVARVNGSITSESIAFGLGPRINAAGRLAHAYSAAKLLAANNSIMAKDLAHKLNDLNRQRQRITAELGQKAEAMVTEDAPIIIAADPDFLPGVVGLVASRLAEKNYRPCIVIEQGETESRGSCRSIPEFHITEALDEVEPLLVRHGGHAQAAGFTIENEHLPKFIERMTEIATKKLADTELHPTITVDMQLDFDAIDWALYDLLGQLEPTGYANPTPVFMSSHVEVMRHRVVGQDGTHLQLTLGSGNGDGRSPKQFAAIAFRQGAWADCLPQFIDIVYTLNVNEWRGKKTLQLMVQDIRPSES
ncbi:MAG: single-stranded-DNA-specific exonuclease RecJ [Chloroflexi bacterium]|nr:single-stranded-DNA-specific exonuclease RecJ [Chloroflexota bacterium]